MKLDIFDSEDELKAISLLAIRTLAAIEKNEELMNDITNAISYLVMMRVEHSLTKQHREQWIEITKDFIKAIESKENK